MNLYTQMTKPVRQNLRHGVLALTLAASASAATITWTSAPATTGGSYGQTLSTGLFDSANVLYAENTGGSAQTFDGISFAAGSLNFGGTYNGFHEGAWLSQSATYSDTAATSTVTLGTGSLPALTIGERYKIQVLVYDGRGDVSGRTVSFDGMSQGTFANGITNVSWGNGLLVTGTFTADAETQVFTIEAFSGSTSKGGMLNALVLNAIPSSGIPDNDGTWTNLSGGNWAAEAN
jgi:hypothetical protein